ncbi:MAG TPA: DUF1877 family protein [Terriglobales bacterium]|jgi:hypothetical protein|nr:DUF1877 family protein [Terriglobales bacterium]
MGMVAEFEQITSQQLETFLENPREAYDYILSELYDNPKMTEHMRVMLAGLREHAKSDKLPQLAKDQFVHTLAKLEAQVERQTGLRLVKSQSGDPQPPPRKKFSLEKNWHVLHYALNGTAEGGKGFLADAVMGGAQIPDVDGVMGYGPLRYFRSQHVKAIVRALEEIDPGTLLSKLDYADAQGKKIYLAHTLDNLNDWSYLPDLFKDFRAFYTDAEQSGNAMLLWIT